MMNQLTKMLLTTEKSSVIQSETLKRKPSKKDAEQDKKIESLEQENKIQTEYIAENFKNINALSEEYQKSFYDLEKYYEIGRASCRERV